MRKIKDQNRFEAIEDGKEFSKSVHQWLAQYDEAEDFLMQRIPKSYSEPVDEE